MFKKLLSNLPFNPSLIQQVSFYAKRLHRETAIRRMGFIFVSLSIVVQVIAMISPAQPSLASTNNNIVPNGFTSQADMVNTCNGNGFRFKEVLQAFNIQCSDLFFGTVRQIDYNEYGGQLYSIGYNAYGFPGERSVTVPNVGLVYARPLTSWGTHCNPGYQPYNCTAVTGVRSDGTPFMVLFSCGNVVTVGPPTINVPTPPPPPPPPTPQKAIFCAKLLMSPAAGTHVPLGTTIGLRGQATGNHLPSGELVDMYYTYTNATNGQSVGEDAAKGIPFDGSNVATDNLVRTFVMSKPGHYRFSLAVKYDGSSNTASGSQTGNCVQDVYVDEEVCLKTPQDDQICTEKHKKARNITQNISDANNTTAKGGDVLEYTLSVKNTSKSTLKNYEVKESVGDILDYADITNISNGFKDQNNSIKWTGKDIKPGDTISVSFTVKVKDPIPQTPTPASNPGSFDMKMTNVYGDTVVINLPPTVVKTAEHVTTTLPNTGPGETLAVGGAVAVIVGYFFARSRLMAKELDLVRSDYATTGGA